MPEKRQRTWRHRQYTGGIESEDQELRWSWSHIQPEQNNPSMTNQSTIDAAPMENVAEAGVVPTPATEALRIFMAHHVHSAATGPTAASHHLRVNTAMEQSCQRRQVQHQHQDQSSPPPPFPTSAEPLDMSDLTRATARVERRALRKKRSSSTTSRNESNAEDEFPAIEWNSDDNDEDEDDDDDDTYATNDDELSYQEREDNENLRGTGMSSGAVQIEGILKDEGDSNEEAMNNHGDDKAHEASPTADPPIRKRRSGDALGTQACADTLQRAKSRKMCLPGCLGPKDADDATTRSSEECGCLATSTTRPTTSIAPLPAQLRITKTSASRQQKSLLADSFMDIVANQTNRQASSPSQTATAPSSSSITARPPSSIAQKPASAASLAATLERVATSENFTSLAPLPPSRATSWGQFVSADNLSPLPSPPSHHYISSRMKRKGSSLSRSHTGLELKKAGSYCNAIAFQRGGNGSPSVATSKRNNSFCPYYKGTTTTRPTGTTTVGLPSPWSSLNATPSI